MVKKQAKKSVKFTTSQTLLSASVKDLKTDESIVLPNSVNDSDSEFDFNHQRGSSSSSSTSSLTSQTSLASRDTIRFNFSLQALPLVQTLGFIVSMYQDYSTPAKIHSYLITQNCVFSIWQLFYGTILISSITEITHTTGSTIIKKSTASTSSSTTIKHKHIKFHLVKDWPLFPLTLTIALTLLIPSVYVLLVLFGAPFNPAYFTQNLLLSWHVVNMILPLLLTYVKIGKVSQGTIVKLTLLVLVGCWLGAVVVPLDWDRPWQTWPLPIVFGAFIGGVLSGVAAACNLL
ncbi:hypothetical protein WICPIJ_005659 [Wickerhamomyces pijperi]|uniref:Glycosylphosphatidylinositol anchor biosynthesis protein 11 n=1 Tax=Wickerhamomyces pijperi TaxID=599730 RepID=A0A9P8Q592_WICPI|nr:hypothetical protein WICPIJ_005659 [Wickerhamomyces pijperi]